MSFGKRFVTKILCHFSFLGRVAIKLKTDHNLLSTKGKVFYDFYMIEERSTEEALNNNASSSKSTLVFHDPYHIPVRCEHSLNKNWQYLPYSLLGCNVDNRFLYFSTS